VWLIARGRVYFLAVYKMTLFLRSHVCAVAHSVNTLLDLVLLIHRRPARWGILIAFIIYKLNLRTVLFHLQQS